MQSVAIFGGGMAGLAVAHELIHRGFVVDVYDKASSFGGKSSSQDQLNAVLPAPTGGRKALLGEHGFRFFPGFYNNVIATMSEIPRPGGGFVSDDLVPSTKAAMVWPTTMFGVKNGFYPFDRQANYPPWDMYSRLRDIVGGLGFTTVDLARMAWFRLKYLSSGPSRRLAYDGMCWEQFIELDSPHYSDGFKEFERSVPRTMSAMAAKTTSAMIVGNVGMQFGLGYTRPGNKEDRLLVGPTDYRWLGPWVAYLTANGVTFHPDEGLVRLYCSTATSTITHATVSVAGTPTKVTADFYVAAVPLEEMKQQIANEPNLATVDPQLAAVATLDVGKTTSWMAGVQFFLKNDVPMVDGHVFYPKSPWALTSVSQAQFWKQSGAPMENDYGDGSVRGVISAIVSDWDTVSPVTGKAAREYLKSECDLLKEEVRRQLREGLPAGFDLSPANAPLPWIHLDENIILPPTKSVKAKNATPLLIHPVNGYLKRPLASGPIANLFLAADYVRTSVGLATMEGANEAARHAVNALLDRAGGSHMKCPIVTLQEDEFFAPARQMDEIRFEQGRAHVMDSCPIRFLKDTGLIDVAQELFKVPAAILLPG